MPYKQNHIHNSHSNNNINSQNTCVFNFTDVRLPKEVEKILNLEPGYGIPLRPKEVPVGTLIKDLEKGIKNINIENVDTKIIKDEQNNVRSKANPNLIITRSDKGNNTVIMKKEEYIKEMKKLLENRNTYSILSKDPTNKFEKLANN
ncbi:PREDICTED: uncharacterized protein LOC106792551 [Polistes canadensis]|uniref:uncharacterized protein LOC106792551 n=1 Tax=Polistes canadensis TaxID=91411 RepID=UPI000718D3D3|nr:PREDICTED: uncharacterized protein LOC106792551 [Polistes canadensis]